MKDKFLEFRKKITASYIAKIALLSAISFILYMYLKFNLPFMFPSFLEMQLSELPAILAGFSLGPTAGAIVIIVKCLLKFPFTSTAFVGEIMDIILGLAYVLPASIIYYRNKNKKRAIIGLAIGTGIATIMSMIFNRVVAVPFYVQLFFGGNFSAIVGVCENLYPGLTESNFYWFYIFVGVLPFNLLRFTIVGIITFFTYKKLSKILHWEFRKKEKNVDSKLAETEQTENKEKTIFETDCNSEDIDI